MSFTQTPNYGLYKPTINADNDQWGTHLNTNSDTLDTTLKTTSNVAGSNVGRNLLHNPLFGVAQRGAGPWTVTGYTADRWAQYFVNGSLSTSILVATDGMRAAIGDEAVASVLQCSVTGSATAGSTTQLYQPIEGVRRLAGKTVTASFWAASSVWGMKLGLSLDQGFGTGGSPSASVPGAVQAVTLSSSWARYSLTFNVPSVAGKTFGTTIGTDATTFDLFLSSQSIAAVGVQTGIVQLWGMQLELSSAATPLEKPDPRYDQSNCSRFFQTAIATSRMTLTGAFPVAAPVHWAQMRATPTASLNTSGTRGNVSSISFVAYGQNGGALTFSTAAAGDAYILSDLWNLAADL